MPLASTINPHDAALPYFPCDPLTEAELGRTSAVHRNIVELDCTPAVLFDVLEDPLSWPRWAPGIGTVVWTSPRPFGVGTTRTVHFWGGMQVYETFVAWEQGRRLAFTFTGTSQLVWTRFGELYEVEELGGGRCRLTWTVSYEPAGGFARAHGVAGPAMGVGFKVYMALLRRYVRRLPRSTPPG